MEWGSMHLHYIEQTYEELRLIDGEKAFKTILCQNRETGEVVIKKQVSLEQGVVYHQLKTIQHPNLIKIYDVCDTQGYCLVVMEFISGQTLEARLDARGFLPAAEAMRYLDQILSALQVVHSHHIIHRDINPANILISSDEVIKVIDFGIARVPKASQKNDTTILGTVGYAAPEQFGFRQTAIQSDIYAVGVLLNKMLTGKMPNQEMPTNRQLRKIITKCIHMDPQSRYDSVGQLKEALSKSGGSKWKISSNIVDKSVWPGFRSGRLWRKIVAVVGYCFLTISSLGLWFLISESQSTFEVMENLYLMIGLWVSFFIVANFYRWDRKVWGIRKLPGPLRIIIRVVLGYLVFHIWGEIFRM